MLDDVSSVLKSSVKKSPTKKPKDDGFELEPVKYDYKLPEMPGVPGTEMSKEEETVTNRLRNDRLNRERRLRIMQEEE